MSAGPFQTVGYLADYGAGTAIHPITVQPETLLLTVTIGGTATTNSAESIDDVTNPISASISRGRRSRGLLSRLIRVKFTDTPPEGYRLGSAITLPVLNKDLMAAPKGATGTYLGADIAVVGVSRESAT